MRAQSAKWMTHQVGRSVVIYVVTVFVFLHDKNICQRHPLNRALFDSVYKPIIFHTS